MKFLAKPSLFNMKDAMVFDNKKAACEYLNRYCEKEIVGKYLSDEWEILGKILSVNEDGTFSKIQVNLKNFI